MISLHAVPLEVARAVVAFGPVPIAHVADWPHDDSADALRPLAEHPEHTPDGTFLVLEDGVVVGECGWFGPPIEGLVDIGYGLAVSARGRGIGTEAVRQLLDWVVTRGAVRARAEVLPSNAASLALLARLGFVDLGEHAGHRVLGLELHRDVDHSD